VATFANLTAEQQAVYLTYEKDLRALAGQTQRLFNQYAALQARKLAQIDAILVALDDNAAVPNTSGLAGTSALDPDAETNAIYADFAAILTTYNTSGKQQLRAKAAGQVNV
jgi:hypothetical protein